MTKKIIKALALFGLFFSGFVGYAPGGYLSRLFIRGKAVYLKIKRRRWRLKSDLGKVARTNFHFAAEGAGFTQELSSF